MIGELFLDSFGIYSFLLVVGFFAIGGVLYWWDAPEQLLFSFLFSLVVAAVTIVAIYVHLVQ